MGIGFAGAFGQFVQSQFGLAGILAFTRMPQERVGVDVRHVPVEPRKSTFSSIVKGLLARLDALIPRRPHMLASVWQFSLVSIYMLECEALRAGGISLVHLWRVGSAPAAVFGRLVPTIFCRHPCKSHGAELQPSCERGAERERRAWHGAAAPPSAASGLCRRRGG